MRRKDIIRSVILLSFLILVTYYIHLTKQPIKVLKDETDFPEMPVVINNTDYNLIPATKLMLIEVLNRDSVFIKFEYMPENYMLTHAAFIIEDFFFKNHYAIYLTKNLKGSHLGVVIGHELVHLDQYESGDLKQLNFYEGIYIYKGDTIYNNFIEHDERPYEIDAMEREEETYYQIFKSLYK